MEGNNNNSNREGEEREEDIRNNKDNVLESTRDKRHTMHDQCVGGKGVQVQEY